MNHAPEPIHPTPAEVEAATAEVSPTEPRRGFFRKALAVVVGSVAMLIPAVAGLVVFTDPLRRKKGAASYLPVAPLDALPADGVPRKFSLVVEKVDAWNKSRDVASVYLVRDQQTQSVTCYSVSCPHAGCAVDWSAATGEAEGSFKCPCHNSSFKRDGSLVPGSVSPRGLDTLEVDPTALQAGQIAVKYEEYLAGTHDKIAKT